MANMECESKTIIGALLEAIWEGNGEEITRLIGLILEGGKAAEEFHVRIKSADPDVIEALQIGAPILF